MLELQAEMEIFMNKEQLHEKQFFTDVRDLVEKSGDMYADRTAYSFRLNPHEKEMTKVSFAELRDDIRALTAELISRGVDGKHCAVIGKFSYNWVLMYFSILAAGGVLVPLDRDWLAKDLAETVKRAETEFLFCDYDQKEKCDVILPESGLTEAVYMSDSKGEGETVSDLVKAGRTKFELDTAVYFDRAVDAERMSLLVFTSGTTGKGKGVMLNQKAIIEDLTDIIPYVDFGRRTVGVLPPHHTYGSSVMLIGHMIIGSEIYISSGLKYIVREFQEIKPRHLCLVPLYLETFYRKMQAAIKEKGKERIVKVMIKISNFLRKLGIDLRKKLFKDLRAVMGGEVKMVISGGAPINGEIVDFFDAIGLSTLNGYGITECAPIIAVNHTKHIVKGSVGFVLDIDTVRIDEPNENGEGEICVKGPNVMLGYYKDENATREAFTPDGYFRTGDYGKFGKDGALFITGRKKNLIILSNGKNVYPEEIENEFVAVPGVTDVIVYEGQSRRGTEHNMIVCEVFPDKDYMEKNGIDNVEKYLKKFIDEYNKTAVPYKKIGLLRVRSEEFPKNTLRKILRFKLDMTID